MTDLLDVNVWLALVDENHVHHERALYYWQNQADSQIAFCRVTLLGFLRLSTHPKVLSRPLTPSDAWEIYQRYRAEAHVVFVEDSSAIDAGFMACSRQSDFVHRMWTDGYLAAFAQFNTCRIISFDSDFNRFPDLNFLQLDRSFSGTG